MPFFIGDYYYWIIVIPLIILCFAAQSYVKSTFKKFSNNTVNYLDANKAVDIVLSRAGCPEIPISKIEGNLTDHYDPRTNTISLSAGVYGSNSVSAVGVAAHEAGHAVQEAKSYLPIKIRSAIAPAANLTSSFAPIMIIIGFLFSFDFLINLGLIFFIVVVAFYFVTLPVEINASRRAVRSLSDSGYMTAEELAGVKKVLTAAALTYVAAAALALGNLLRFFLLSRGRNRN
ncbi:MAG: zinc metallopeptidase [Clostridiales bacterium]|nr:zinc metallopeptidase [Clostridiales bacterium]